MFIRDRSVFIARSLSQGELMINLKRVVKTAAVSGALVVAAATPALATVVNVGGGKWDYGAGTAIVWSDYYHGSKCHGSTSVGQYVDADEAAAKSWSLTQAEVALSGNKSYYSTTC
ncbi:lactococcin 972 family bacteriocin [Streptomyces sp. NPDC101062]|uniref:lactococcin 972 family bacteriocin n=1 Tax=unclassified Streptomyces TaxID=2593676 RepID=UPI003829BDD8